MTATMQSLITNIDTLNPIEKGFIAQYILASLDTKHDKNSEKIWAKLVQKRYQEIESGTVQTLSWDEIKQKVLSN
ncbi:MAG: addiction module protein [Epsilonproteobacteria bacterium]|nr:addiction module protein [Campylobacterota bacterium]